VKLYSVKIEGKKPGGWESAELFFANYVTELFGPNGSGKTPIVHSIVFALGYPVKYRDDILANCDAAVLTLVDSENAKIRIRRRIGVSFDVEVRSAAGSPQTFYNEHDYSRFLFEMFGFKFPALTSTGNEATSPYLATILPIFYLNQDIGYTSAYRAPANFIRDQYAEMMRLAFDVPPKNSFDQKKLALEKRKRRDHLDKLVVKKAEQIEQAINDLGKMRRPITSVADELSRVRADLNALRGNRSAKSDAHVALDSLLYERKSQRREVASEVSELRMRVGSFNRIQNEIETEVNTLSLNEEARRLFASFKDICANPVCGLFLGNSESYGKNLLYLRDQIKDLDRNNANNVARIKLLEEELRDLDSDVSDLEEKQAGLNRSEDTSGVVEATSELTRAMIALQAEHTRLEAIDVAEKEYVSILNERKIVQDELASFEGGSGTSDLRALEIRAALRDRTRHWLDILQTRNVSREIVVDADFDFLFGTEKLNQFSGSTLLRVVLAMRTAAFDVYARDAGKRFRFLILDTPRQHDIEKEALARYISELKALIVERNAQVIFSTTDYHYECGEGDVQWSPEFEGVEQKMFLRSVE